jgi:5'-phosphate synthase pdxT subunit
MTIGVLAMQGGFAEHRKMLGEIGVESAEVRNLAGLDLVSGLIIPGGESTTLSKLLHSSGLFDELRRKILSGFPVWGTCAGAILLAKKITGSDTAHLAVMDIEVERNAYGRQAESFIGTIKLSNSKLETRNSRLSDEVEGVFIRAPKIVAVDPAVEVIARCDGNIVAAKQGNMIATTFHPELTSDTGFHNYFCELVMANTHETR